MRSRTEQRAAHAMRERVPAFRIARLRDLTFDAVSEDRHRHGRDSFCLCLANVGISPVLLHDSPACFLFTPSLSLALSHIGFATSLSLSLSSSLFFFLSTAPYPSHLRGQSYGESDRAAVSVEGAGWMKVVGGRRRDGELCVELIRAWLTGSRL